MSASRWRDQADTVQCSVEITHSQHVETAVLMRFHVEFDDGEVDTLTLLHRYIPDAFAWDRVWIREFGASQLSAGFS